MKLKPATRIKISIIGAGNIAFNLSRIFSEKGNMPYQIFARNPKHHAEFQAYATSIITNIEDLESCDILILAVNDDAVSALAGQLNVSDTLVVHTSGTLNGDAAKSVNNQYGVFYPLQTFSKSRRPNFNDIPVFVQASDEKSLGLLQEMARMITSKVYLSDDRTRNVLHVAAVFVSNFSHALYAIAEDFLTKEAVPFGFLHPLINESVFKAISGNIMQNQTGPARRNDLKTITKHLELLRQYPEKKEIYELFSRFILNKYHPNNK